MDRAIPSAFAGNAGEFFVLAELTRRGWTAALTARNNRAYDILGKRDDEFAAAVSVRQILATEKKESHAMQRIAAPPQLIRRNRWAYYGAGLLRVGRTEGDGTVYIYAGCGRRCSRGRFD